MASRKEAPVTITARDVGELIKCYEDQISPGITEPTQFVIPSISGTIDPYTEEVTFHTSETLFNASGILGTINQDDLLFGLNGRIQVGDTKITYGYNMVSGILGFDVSQIKLLTAGVSGLYLIQGRYIDVIGNMPVFVDYALKTRQDG